MQLPLNLSMPYWLLCTLFYLVRSGLLIFLFIQSTLPYFLESDQRLRKSVFNRPMYLLSMLITLIISRMPIILFNRELNPDEAQMLAGAITLSHDPVFWRSVDGTTHGPFDQLPLLLPRLFDLPINFHTGRVIGILSVFACLYLLYLGNRSLFSEKTARLAVFPAACFFALTDFFDFVHYSSEHIPILMISLLNYCFLRACVMDHGKLTERRFSLIVAGTLVFLIPLAKLQAALFSACFWFIINMFLIMDSKRIFKSKLMRVSAFNLSIVGVMALFLTYLKYFELVNTFIAYYLLNNIFYVSAGHVMVLSEVMSFLKAERSWQNFVLLSGTSAIFGLFFNHRYYRKNLGLTLSVILLNICALATVLTPNRPFPHYLLFLVFPLCQLVALLISPGYCAMEEGENPQKAALPLKVYHRAFFACVLTVFISSLFLKNHFLPRNVSEMFKKSAVSVKIGEYAEPGESLGMWGWMCRYYVETGMRQATREAHTERQIRSHPQRDLYKLRYLTDLKQSFPAAFIDAVGPDNFAFEDRTLYGHENFPELNDFIRERYTLVGDIDNTRIYIRNDRISMRR